MAARNPLDTDCKECYAAGIEILFSFREVLSASIRRFYAALYPVLFVVYALA
jgi:hypothetical protein